jgi:hypothetical protein
MGCEAWEAQEVGEAKIRKGAGRQDEERENAEVGEDEREGDKARSESELVKEWER